MIPLDPDKDFIARHPLIFFIFLPVFTLPVFVVASGAAEIFLDHDVLGRATNGLPLLSTLPWARSLVAGWNLALVYLAPALISIAAWVFGRTRNVGTWTIIGGTIVCFVGGFHYIEAGWTGVKGTSVLRVGFVDDFPTAAVRIGLNLVMFMGAVLISNRHAVRFRTARERP